MIRQKFRQPDLAAMAVTLLYLPPYSPERNPKEKGSDRDGGEGVCSHGRVFDFGGVAPALGGRGRARTRSTI
jgi:hypothetical protein